MIEIIYIVLGVLFIINGWMLIDKTYEILSGEAEIKALPPLYVLARHPGAFKREFRRRQAIRENSFIGRLKKKKNERI